MDTGRQVIPLRALARLSPTMDSRDLIFDANSFSTVSHSRRTTDARQRTYVLNVGFSLRTRICIGWTLDDATGGEPRCPPSSLSIGCTHTDSEQPSLRAPARSRLFTRAGLYTLDVTFHGKKETSEDGVVRFVSRARSRQYKIMERVDREDCMFIEQL